MNEVTPPSEEELAKVEAKLRRRPPGTQLRSAARSACASTARAGAASTTAA